MRILHTMIRVGDLDKSIAFYTDVLGMKLLRRKDYPEGKYTLAFIGYGEESEGAVIELTYNWGVASYELGTGYGHIAIQVDDIRKTCEAVAAKGGKVVYGPALHGGATWIAFVEDPDVLTSNSCVLNISKYKKMDNMRISLQASYLLQSQTRH